MLQSIFSPSRVYNKVTGGSKKRVLENVAELIAADQPGYDADEIFKNLVAREKLGSTGIGFGFAIPHCRLSQCNKPFGAIIRLAEAIDFDAVDNTPVSVLFVLLVPEAAHQDHLDALAALAQRCNDPQFRQRFQSTVDAQETWQLLTAYQQSA